MTTATTTTTNDQVQVGPNFIQTNQKHLLYFTRKFNHSSTDFIKEI